MSFFGLKPNNFDVTIGQTRKLEPFFAHLPAKNSKKLAATD